MSTKNRCLRLVAVFTLLLLVLCACNQGDQDDDVVNLTMATWLNDTQNYNPTIRYAQLFNEIQDDIHIDVISFDPNEYENNTSASLEAAYASFIAGEAPDLYDTISFDASRLRTAGLVADWYPLMEADETFHMEDYHTHIWELMETDGALYQMITSFGLYGMSSTRELVGDRTGWTLEEFEIFLAENPQLGVTQEWMLQLLLWYGVQFDYMDLATKTCDFESQSFFTLLDFLSQLPTQLTSEEELRVKDLSSVRGHIPIGPDNLDPVEYWDEGNYPRYVGLPTAEGDGPAVAIYTSFALSATTEHTKACWTFIRWMLSQETQLVFFGCPTYEEKEEFTGGFNTYQRNGLPMRLDVWEETLRRAMLDSSQEESVFYGEGEFELDEDGVLVLVRPWPGIDESEVDYLRSLVDNANRTAMGFFDYESLTDVIEEEVLAFLAGDKTAEECAHLIQSRVSIMLAEMQ